MSLGGAKGSASTVLLAATLIIMVVLVGLTAYSMYQVQVINRKLSDISSSVSNINSTVMSEVSSRLANESEYLGELLSQLNTSVSSQVAKIRGEVSGLEASIGFPVAIVDALNQTVYVPSMPHRVVTLDPASTEIALAVGAAGQLVGVDNDSLVYLPPPFNYTINKLYQNGSVASIGSTWSSPSVEAILALRPDLVIGTAGWGYNNYIASVLSQYGIPVLLLPSSSSLSDVYKSIIMVGEATGHVKDAVSIVENDSAIVDSLESRLHGLPEVRVAIILWVNPTYVAGGGTFQDNLITLGGGVNAFANSSGWPVVTAEELLEVNPQVIILMSNGGLFNESYLIQWLNSSIGPAYKNISAIASGRVYLVEGWYESVLSEPSVLAPYGALLIAEILHPQAFNISSLPSVISPSTLGVPGVNLEGGPA
ncbi:Putative ABC transporter, substrate binding protein [Acidilobus saccharovorans 345-15]|uniref:Putative ABC transporter, substrate binding protein n=1 Tax=Acidilobus saccharovorans (strain DSM 16705 / JCM 18335 / VKM B-2471 / 345-15) TaxID=666510 RepID=D9Q0S0_ACIS3|nr:ABC transporter substrate-binding protein [Acidilobus saccharovorans]ADL18908.1 Putative ABC transporter, substrate binding protein [Acidilobus saccharovorans 345-15]